MHWRSGCSRRSTDPLPQCVRTSGMQTNGMILACKKCISDTLWECFMPAISATPALYILKTGSTPARARGSAWRF
jgi:hypothetical protein